MVERPGADSTSGLQNFSGAEFTEAAAQKAAFRFLPRELERARVGATRFGGAARAAAEIGVRGVRQVIGCKRRFCEHRLDLGESGFSSVPQGEADRAIERDDGRR